MTEHQRSTRAWKMLHGWCQTPTNDLLLSHPHPSVSICLQPGAVVHRRSQLTIHPASGRNTVPNWKTKTTTIIYIIFIAAAHTMAIFHKFFSQQQQRQLHPCRLWMHHHHHHRENRLPKRNWFLGSTVPVWQYLQVAPSHREGGNR